MMAKSKLIIFLLSMISATVVYSQNIKDVPDSLKRDIYNYFQSAADDTVASNLMDPDVYTSFQVPEFKYIQLQLGSNELLRITRSGDQLDMSGNFLGNYRVFKQSLYTTSSYSIVPVFDFAKSTDVDAFSALQLALPFDISKYFKQEYAGPQVFAGGSFGLAKIGEADLINPLNLTAGIGYGRITSVRPIARAVALATEVGSDISNADIIEIANIITKNNDGYYANKFKADANIRFYNQLAEALNAPDQIMRIQQILTDAAFSNISDRRIGFQVRLGYSNVFLTDAETTGSVVVRADYAKPIGFKNQAILGLQITAPEKGDTEIGLTGKYTIDHSITWVSAASFASDDASTDIELSTTKIVLNKISGQTSLIFSQAADGDVTMNFLVKFMYFAF